MTHATTHVIFTTFCMIFALCLYSLEYLLLLFILISTIRLIGIKAHTIPGRNYQRCHHNIKFNEIFLNIQPIKVRQGLNILTNYA